MDVWVGSWRRQNAKDWCFWTVVLGKTLEGPLDCKEIKPVNPKGNQPWIFIGKTDGEAEATVLWLPNAKSWLIRKDPDARGIEGKRRGWQEMMGCHHWLNGYEFVQTQGDSDGQISLVCCSSFYDFHSCLLFSLKSLNIFYNNYFKSSNFWHLDLFPLNNSSGCGLHFYAFLCVYDFLFGCWTLWYSIAECLEFIVFF